jgi:hypothetical protein
MIDINKEAEELFPINSTKGSMEILSRHQLNNSLKQEGFKKAFESKNFQAKVLQGQIDVLKEIDFNMYMLLKNEATNLDLAEVDLIHRWNKTKWHLEIDKKIKELQQQLKQLENEI